MESPISAVASSAAGDEFGVRARRRPRGCRCCRCAPGSCQSGSCTNAAVGEVVAFTSARVFCACILSSASPLGADHQVAADHEVAHRRCRGARRACRPGSRAMRTCDITAPYFCARPDMSSTDTPLPSRCAAMPRICADGDDAGAADAGHQHAEGLLRASAERGLRQRGKIVRPPSPRTCPSSAARLRR